MTGNPAVIANLLSLLQEESQLNMQYRHVQRVMGFMGLKPIKHKMKSYGDDAHDFQAIADKRILVLSGDSPNVTYDVGRVTEPESLTDCFKSMMSLEVAVMKTALTGIQTAVKAGDEATAEKLRHVEERHETHIAWFEKQLRLIAKLTETGYITEKI